MELHIPTVKAVGFLMCQHRDVGRLYVKLMIYENGFVYIFNTNLIQAL